MDTRSFGYLGVFLVFFVLWEADSCEGNRRILDKASYGNDFHLRDHDVGENTGDQVSLFCRKQLKQITEAIKYFNLNLPEVTNHHGNSDVRRMLVKKAITGQPRNLKQSLPHCLKSIRSLSDYPMRERSLEFLGRPNGRILKPKNRRRKRKRRRRRRRPRQPWSSDPAPVPSPASVPSPSRVWAPSPTLTPDRAPPPTQTPDAGPPPSGTPDGPPSLTPTSDEGLSPSLAPDEAPSLAPTPSGSGARVLPPSGPPFLTPNPSRSQSPTPTPKPSRKPKPLPERFPKPSTKPSPDVDSHPLEKTKQPPGSPPKANSKERKLLIIAVSASIVASLAILSLFLICFFRLRKRRKPNDGGREGRRFSTGSLLKSKKGGSKKDIMRNMSTNGACMSGDQVSEVGSLPLPPGRFAPPTSTPLEPPAPAAAAAPPPPLPLPTPPLPLPTPPQPARPPPEAPPPPPPLKAANVPNPPKAKPPPPVGLPQGRTGNENNETGDSDANKAKLKPFFWDKVNTSPNRSMVWHDIKAGSFQFNEEMMENLFGYGSSGQNKNENGKNPPNLQNKPKLIQIIEPKKAQNLAILLKALNVTTEEVSDAIMEGNELPIEFISTLLKMAPTPEEELKLRSYNGNLALLGPSERFLKVLVDIPFAFKRLEALLFMSSLHEESSSVKDSFSTLEVACTTLRNSRLFLKLLEAVLKTGNRMNVGTYRGGAQAFKLDTLLKLSDVKGTDGKTTLLSFVVQEMIRSEGNKAARRAGASQSSSEDVLQQPSKEDPGLYGLEVVSKLSEELEDVKKAAVIDGDTLTSTVLKLGNMLRKTKDFLNNEMKTTKEDTDIEFRKFLTEFVDRAEAEIMWLLEEEKRVMALVKSTGDYFHGNARKDEGLHLFVVVRDFLILLDNVCNDIRRTTAMQAKKNQSNSQESFSRCEKLFPSSKDGQSGYSSSDEENQENDSP